MSVKKLKLSALVLDYSLYPRHKVDETHVRQMMEAVRSGVVLPPIVADLGSKRVSDGFHRHEVHRRLFGDQADVAVDLVDYPDEGALFEEAIRYNASHGNNLTPFDRARCIERAVELHIDPDRLASALQMTTAKVDHMRVTKTALNNGGVVAIKGTARHLAGKRLTKPQLVANEKAAGMSGLFYVNQVINLIEGDLLDRDNPRLMARLEDLHHMLASVVSVAAM